MKEIFIEYKHGDDILEAYCAYPESVISQKHPLVLISHAWAGRDDFAINTARDIANKGYVGFALDLYGKGKIGKTVEEKAALMMPFMENRSFLHKRLLCNIEQAKRLDFVDTNNIAVIGFCFGGLCALDLARIGVNIKGVVSFHGLLSNPGDISYGDINSKILVLHGADDPMVSFADVENFSKEMNLHDADWQINIYSNTKHGFSVPGANDLKLGVVYNNQTAKRAWGETYGFLNELFL
tara:strand:- start:7062 stop:7778 length:717 start_codon:yes stop_codon:yes gene_type:complete